MGRPSARAHLECIERKEQGREKLNQMRHGPLKKIAAWTKTSFIRDPEFQAAVVVTVSVKTRKIFAGKLRT